MEQLAVAYRSLDLDDGDLALAASFARWTMLWIVAFYALVLGEPYWASRMPESSKAHENCKYWKARNVLGILHALLVSCLVLPLLPSLLAAPEDRRFAWTTNVATCSQSTIPELHFAGQAVALSGLIFTAFIAADLVISLLHRLASPDYVLHHVAFLGAGVVIRSHCMLPLNAAILLAMEVSTPFLNFMLLFRNRGPAYRDAVQVTGILFVALFVAFRLLLNTYGAALLWIHRHAALPPAVPAWQGWFLLGAISAGSALQFFWFPAIAKIFCAGLMELLSSRQGPPHAADRPVSSADAPPEEPCSPGGTVALSSRSLLSSGEVTPTSSVSSKASTADELGNSCGGGACACEGRLAIAIGQESQRS